MPPNTAKNTRWARNCFLEWMYERNGLSDEKCPENILEEQCATDLNTCFSNELETVANSLDSTAKDEDLSVKIENGFPLCFMAVRLDRYQFSLIIDYSLLFHLILPDFFL